MKFREIFLSVWRFRETSDFFFTNVPPYKNVFCYFFFFALFFDLTKLNLKISSNFFQVKVSYPVLLTIHSNIVRHFNISICYHYITQSSAHSGRATSGGRREIELNSGSLPPIPGRLATLGVIHYY